MGGSALFARVSAGDDIAAACGQLAGDVVDRTRVRERAVHDSEIIAEAPLQEQPIAWLNKLN